MYSHILLSIFFSLVKVVNLDTVNDGVNSLDNCPTTWNPLQKDDDSDGNIIGTSCRDIQSNRKVQVNLGQYPKGVYLVQSKGETINKTVKVIKH